MKKYKVHKDSLNKCKICGYHFIDDNDKYIHMEIHFDEQERKRKSKTEDTRRFRKVRSE